MSTAIDISMASRFQLNGLQTSSNTNMPFVASNTVAIVDSSSKDRLNIFAYICKNIMSSKLHMPPGRAFLNTLRINLPWIRDVVGSMVRKNEGIPIVKALIKDS